MKTRYPLKVLSIFLAALIIIPPLQMRVSAEDNPELIGLIFTYPDDDGIKYEVTGFDETMDIRTVKVIAKTKMNKSLYSGDIEIPETVEDEYGNRYIVNEIGDKAFQKATGLRSIVLPDTIDTIGSYAFYNTGLVSIVIPDKVADLPSKAFSGVLQDVTLPVCLEDIASDAFTGDSFLNFNISKDNENYAVKDGVLYSKDMKALIKFPSGRKGGYKVPNGVQVITPGAFWDCYNLDEISFPASLMEIEAGAFQNCNIKTLNFQNSHPPIIGDFVSFYNTGSFGGMTVYVPDGAVETYIEAWNYSDNLGFDVTFLEASGRIEDYWGEGIFEYGGIQYQITDFDEIEGTGSIMVIQKTVGEKGSPNPPVSTYTGDIEVPELVEYQSTEFTVTGISNYAFRNAENVTSVILPDTIERIGAYAFAGTRIESIVIPDKVEMLSDGAFDCEFLKTITLPAGLESWHSDTFGTGLLEFKISGDNERYTVRDGVLFGKDMKTLVMFPAGISGTYVVPDGVEVIADASFVKCYKLDALMLPRSLREIMLNAFIECDVKLVYPEEKPPADDPPTIGDIFEYNSILYEVIGYDEQSGDSTVRVLPKSQNGEYESLYAGNIAIPKFASDGTRDYTVTEIGDNAFNGAVALTSIGLPDSIEKIGHHAFHHTGLTVIQIPYKVKRLESGALNSEYLMNVYLPLSLEYIDESGDEVFGSGLQGLYIGNENKNYATGGGILFTKDMKTLVRYPSGGQNAEYIVPDGVEVIGHNAFYKPSSELKTVRFPQSLRAIEERAFFRTGIEALYFQTEVPPEIRLKDFSLKGFFKHGFPYGVQIFVPDDCVDAYLSVWGDLEWDDGGEKGKVIVGKGGYDAPPGGDVGDNGTGGNGGTGENVGDGGNGDGGGNPNFPTNYVPTATGSDSSDSAGTDYTSTSTTSDFRSLQNQLNQALNATGATNSGVAVLRIVGYTGFDLDTLRQLAASAKAAGKSCMINADTVVGKAVQTRIAFYPGLATKGILLGGSTTSSHAQSVRALYERYFQNKVAVVELAQQSDFGMDVSIAVKVDLTGLNINTLRIYSYNKSTNTYTSISNPRVFIDANNYLWFSTRLAGDIIITDKPLILK